jgi:hypothetical protein
MLNKRSKILIFLFAVMLMLASYQYYRRKQIFIDGIYLKCIITDVHSYKGGVSVTVKYKYHDKEYQSTMSRTIKMSQIGKQFFIKLKPGNPDEIVLLDTQSVPDCLSEIEPPRSGWKEIPGCN